MKSKIEEKLDKEFEKLGITPKIFHFVGEKLVFPYAAITIADTAKYASYERVLKYVNRAIDESCFSEHNSAGLLKSHLNVGAWGAAVCDRRDQFNRQRGRIIAKGRLLKHLKRSTEK